MDHSEAHDELRQQMNFLFRNRLAWKTDKNRAKNRR